MQVIAMIFLTMLTLATAGFAHSRIATHSTSRLSSTFSHGILVLVGTGFAWAMQKIYHQPTDLLNWMIALSAFGAVHVPAAFILFIKDRQHSK